MLTSAVHNAAAACRIRRARCPLPWANGELWTSEAKRSWLSRRWFAENSCSTCRTVHRISPDGYTEPACACYDTDGTCEGTLFTAVRVPQMSVQYCPNCSCEFSKRQTTSDNYKHLAKCLADAAGKQGCEITVNSFVHCKVPERPAVVVSRPSWETIEPDFATECRFNLCLDQVRQLHVHHKVPEWSGTEQLRAMRAAIAAVDTTAAIAEAAAAKAAALRAQLNDARAAQTQQRSVLDVIPQPRHAVTQPANWKADMRSSIANMDTALARAAFRRTTRPHTTW